MKPHRGCGERAMIGNADGVAPFVQIHPLNMQLMHDKCNQYALDLFLLDSH
tara:strand:- start:481 stop:633 length:153 start_codon:yes stop_codon:yes gene_type:complete